jgi:hypothetical protein
MFAYMMGKYASLYAICRNVALRSKLGSEYICKLKQTLILSFTPP